MTHSGFTTRKLEQQYDLAIHSVCELLSYKVMELISVLDHAGVNADDSPASTHQHLRWASRFFEQFKSVYKLEKARYQDPKLVNVVKPLASFLHKR